MRTYLFSFKFDLQPLDKVMATLVASLLYTANVAKGINLTPEQAHEIVREVDERQRNAGDFTSECFIKEVSPGKNDKILQITYFRRDADNKILILIRKPKEEAGKGYLKVDKNMWMYDPSVGKWERRTEREHIGGTNSRRSDFDESRLADEYDVKPIGEDTIGKYSVHKLELTAKNGIDVAYPKVILLVDKEEKNMLKREEYSLSGKLMRTAYYPRWEKKFSAAKKENVWIPKEIRVIDELEKGNSTVIAISKTDFSPLPDSTFSKAWIETQSR